jgi:hypothetical protein
MLKRTSLSRFQEPATLVVAGRYCLSTGNSIGSRTAMDPKGHALA